MNEVAYNWISCGMMT